MVIWDDLLAYLSRGLGAVMILAATFWKGDDLLSQDGRKLIASRLDVAIAAPSAENARTVSEVVQAYYSGPLPAWRFVLNVLLFTITSMLLLMIVYVTLVPNFFTQLLHDPYQRSEVVSQFLFDGLTKAFVANYTGFSIFALRSEQADFDPVRSLFVDVVIKIVVFIALTAIIYVGYARLSGAFNGSDRLALAAVGPTMLEAAKFRNLTSVYLYSVAISSLPYMLLRFSRRWPKVHVFRARSNLRSFGFRFGTNQCGRSRSCWAPFLDFLPCL